MREAADEQEYERAARLRDDIGALRRAIEKQAVVLADDTDADVVAFAQDELEAAVFVFHVRGGPGARAARLRRRQARGRGSARAGRAVRVAGVSGRRVRGAARGAGARGSGGRRRRRRVAVPAARQPGRDPGAAARRQACAAGDRRSQRRSRRSPSTSCAGRATSRPARRALSEIAGGARPRRCSAAHRMLRRLEPAGHERRRDRWSSSRTGSRASPSTAASPSAAPAPARRPRTTAVRRAGVEGGDVDWLYEAVRRRFARYLDETVRVRRPPTRLRCGRSDDRRRASSPTRRTSWWSTAASLR